jgi:hypothetical protein
MAEAVDLEVGIFVREAFPQHHDMAPPLTEYYANGTRIEEAADGVMKEAFVSSITLAMVAITVVSFCLARRLAGVSCYRGLPLARWCKFLFFLSLMFWFNSNSLK